MYIDLIILIVLILVVFFFFRKFSSIVYFIAIVEILLRILTFFKNNIPLPDVSALINKYIPESISAIIGNYFDGVLYTILVWLFVIVMIIFESYIIRTFWKKKK